MTVLLGFRYSKGFIEDKRAHDGNNTECAPFGHLFYISYTVIIYHVVLGHYPTLQNHNVHY